MMRSSFALVALVLLAACAPSTVTLREKAARLAAKADLRSRTITTRSFNLQAFERITKAGAPVRVFIEGDGNAWLTRERPSQDPTPFKPTALFLATMDDSPNVVYLGRPCQYLASPNCEMRVWTHGQYSDNIIANISEALDQYKGHPIELVGYSGGGAVSLLLAARRNDIISIRTVAGNIDTDIFVKTHHVSPLTDSLNPAAYKEKTSHIPQIHFAGANDKVVPPALAQAYQASLPAKNCSTVLIVPNTDHAKGWPEHWKRMTARTLPCTDGALAH